MFHLLFLPSPPPSEALARLKSPSLTYSICPPCLLPQADLFQYWGNGNFLYLVPGMLQQLQIRSSEKCKKESRSMTNPQHSELHCIPNTTCYSIKSKINIWNYSRTPWKLVNVIGGRTPVGDELHKNSGAMLPYFGETLSVLYKTVERKRTWL